MWQLLIMAMFFPLIIFVKILAYLIKFIVKHRTTRWIFIYLPVASLGWLAIDPELPAWQLALILTPIWLVVWFALEAVVLDIVEPDIIKRIRRASRRSWLTGPRLAALLAVVASPVAAFYIGSDGLAMAGSVVLASSVWGGAQRASDRHLVNRMPVIGTDPDGYVLPVDTVLEADADEYSGGKWVDLRRDTSTLLCGATRSGKSEAAKLLVYQMVRDWNVDEPLVCYDRKDDWKQFFENEGVAYDILSADRSETTVYWNLFDEIETERDIERIGRALFETSDSNAARQSDDFFAVAARQVFVGLVKYLRREIRDEGAEPTNADLVRFVQRKSREDAFEALAEYDDLRPAAQAIDPDAEAQAAGVWASLSQEVQDIFVGAFRAVPDRADSITLREYIENPQGRALVVSHPRGFGDAVERIYSYLIDDAIRQSMARDGGSVLVLDELPQLPQLNRLEELVNVGAGENVRTLVTIQSVAQMRDVYGDDAATSLLAGMASKVLMRSGDPDTTEFYRGEIGRRFETVETDSTTFQDLTNASSGTSRREEERAPMDERELRSLEAGEAIITRPDGWLRATLPMLDDGGRERIDSLVDLPALPSGELDGHQTEGADS